MTLRFTSMAILLLLAACTTDSEVAQTVPPPPPIAPVTPLRPPEPLTLPPVEPARSAGPPPVQSAGTLTLADIGTYMDTQEKELRALLRGSGGLVMRPGDDLVIVLHDDLLFEGMQVTSTARELLENLALVLRRYDRTSIQIQSYTDTRGTPERNLSLSDTRAKAVSAVLLEAGLPRTRVSAQGFGETRLRVATGDNVNEPRNQRIEIRVIARPG